MYLINSYYIWIKSYSSYFYNQKAKIKFKYLTFYLYKNPLLYKNNEHTKYTYIIIAVFTLV